MSEMQTLSWSALLCEGNRGKVFILCAGVWLHAADSLLIATMIPDILRDIGGAALVPWSVALYEIGSITVGAAGALLVLKLGLKRAMLLSALVYAFGCVVSALAPNMPLMLSGRLLQGLGGGGLMTLSLVGVNRLFAGPALPRMMAAVSGVWGSSAFIGPLIGGFFAEIGWWRGGFWFFAVQAILLMWVITQLLDADKHPQTVPGSINTRIPIWRLLLLASAVVLVAGAGVEVVFPQSVIFVVSGLLALCVFFYWDADKGENRLFLRQPWNLFKPGSPALVMGFCLAMSTIALTLYGPILVQILYGVSPLMAGYLVAAASIGWSVAALITAGLQNKDRILIRMGASVVMLSILGFIMFMGQGPFWVLMVLSFMEGAGFGMCWTFVLRQGSAPLKGTERDRLASGLTTLQRLGYALGAAFVGIVANSQGFADDMSLEAARSVAFWLFSACLPMALLGLYAAFCLTSEKLMQEV